MKTIFFTLLTIVFVCCKQQTNQDITINSSDEINFNGLLNCNNYSFEETYLVTPDNGCVYNPTESNKLGNIIIYLIPKIDKQNFNINNVEENKITENEIKEKFDIYIYFISKNYLVKTPEGYYPNKYYEEELYTYESKVNRWLKLDKIIIKDNSNQKEIEWREKFIKEKIKKVNSINENSDFTISEKWYGNYFFTINENHKDWRDIQDVSLKITSKEILFHVEGYQIDQNYRLLAKESNEELILSYKNSLDDYQSAVLEKTKDFGTVSFDGNKYIWNSPYLDDSFMDEKKTTFILNRK